ncbi:hypothetical protein ENHAE0001_2500 [Enhydrobacter aerosaccus SK60]|nr:hypothetical protein ENHAE0001_2500 [Enhydrobacter aerosaccus SK60]
MLTGFKNLWVLYQLTALFADFYRVKNGYMNVLSKNFP